MAFYARVNALIASGMTVLDYGCGTAAHYGAEDRFTQSLQNLRGRVTRVIGAGVSSEPPENPTIDAYVVVGDDGTIPVEAGTVDLALCDWGLEHFRSPDKFFAEMNRVLAPNGHLCIRTPNSMHYSSIGARVLPFRFHAAVRDFLGQFHTEQDVFPTYYRCNRRRRLERVLRSHGFEAVVLPHRGESHLRDARRALGWVVSVARASKAPQCRQSRTQPSRTVLQLTESDRAS